MFRLRNANTVLVVDDEFGTREALRMILQDKYNVLTCENPQEALDVISSRRVDIAMLDIRMPKIDGLKLLKAMKSITQDLQVVLITAYPSTQTAVKALRYGAYDYIIKPFEKEKIEKVVRQGIIRRTQKNLEKNLISGLMSEVYQKFSNEE